MNSTADFLDANQKAARGLWVVVGIVVVAGLAIFLRSRIASIPLERDEGEYGYIAQRWLAGEVPYRSAFDQKPPGVFAAYAVILSVFGSSPEAIHWGAQVFTFGTLGLIYLVGRRLFGPLAGVAAALLATFMTADRCVLGNAANTEMFMILPLTAGLLAAMIAAERSSLSWAAVAGVCGTLAMLCKQVALPNVAFYGLLLLTAPRQRMRLFVTYFVAALIALLPVFHYFARVGAMDEFLDCVFLHNVGYAQQVPLWHYPKVFLAKFSIIALQWCPILLLALAGYCGDKPRCRIVVWWLAASIVGVAIGGYFREHYFVQIIPPLAVLAGQGAVAVGRRWAPKRPVVAAVIVGLAILYGTLVMPRYWIVGTPTDACRILYNDAPFPEAVAVGSYLRSQADPNDTLFIYGSESEIYFYSGCRAASRYIFLYPLLTPAPDVLDRQQNAMKELIENRPRFIVVHRDVFPPVGGSPPTYFKDELSRLLDRSYDIVGVAGPMDTAVRPFVGPVSADQTTSPAIDHTLAVWRRRES